MSKVVKGDKDIQEEEMKRMNQRAGERKVVSKKK